MTDTYFDLGNYCREISSLSDDAQLWFNRGLIWCYSFNFEAAVNCFGKALEFDRDCAIAHWGIAYAAGPYYNKQWHQFDPLDLEKTLALCHAESRRAVEKMANCGDLEQALIRALARRYQSETPPEDFSQWNDDYADAMRDVYRAYTNDPDVAALFVDAMMNRTPWDLWDVYTGKPKEGADTIECVSVLDSALAKHAERGEGDHPGLLHLYIHVLEMSRNPEKALRAADTLRHLVPDAAHLRHMSTHIDAQCGDYYNVVASNSAAVEADKKYTDLAGKENFNALSRAHNYHFKLYGAMLLGNYAEAMVAADGIVETIPESLLRVESPPMADWLEGYISMKVHAPIRFGRWQDIIDEPLPRDRELYCATTAMQHYGKTLGHAVLANIGEAEQELQLFLSAVEKVPHTRMIFNNSCRNILLIAREMAFGELEYRKQNIDVAFNHLRAAVKLSDEMPYDEPWGWMQPARHALGALLLEQGCVAEAEVVYREDLGLDDSVIRPCQHRDNVWGLHGFHECLVKQGKTAEAALIAPKLQMALARTDVPIKASCLCRLQHAD